MEITCKTNYDRKTLAAMSLAARKTLRRRFSRLVPIYSWAVMALLVQKGWQVGNVDATVLAQRPKLAAHIPQMRENLARCMGISPERVNVKATTEEGLGFTGAGEGMAAHAVCLLEERRESR